jgi:hypothetical protein
MKTSDPKENLDEETIKGVREEIIAADVFESTGGASLASIKKAQKVQNSVEVSYRILRLKLFTS